MLLNPIKHITFDCHDPMAMARFWAAVTGYAVEAEPEEDEVLVEPPVPGTPGLLFIQVPEGKRDEPRTDSSPSSLK